MNEQIKQYIHTQRLAGHTDDAIKKALQDAGWKSEDIERCFSGNGVSRSAKLKSPIDLLSDSFGFLFANIKALMFLQLVPFSAIIVGVIIGFIVAFAVNSVSNTYTPVAVVIVGLLLVIPIVYLSLWSYAAVIMLVLSDTKLTAKQAFLQAKGNVGRFYWTSILQSLVILGGFVFLIVPGIIIAVWYSFASYIALSEKIGGYKALQRSQQYVRGHWWSIAGRLLFISLVPLIVGIITGSLSEMSEELQWFAALFSFVLNIMYSTISMVYYVFLYKNIKEVYPQTQTTEKTSKLVPVLLTIAGLLFPVGIFAAVTLIAINPARQLDKARTMQVAQDTQYLQGVLGMYYAQYGQYPESLEVLVPEFAQQVPLHPNGREYTYTTVTSGGRPDYSLCIPQDSAAKSELCCSSSTQCSSMMYSSTEEAPDNILPVISSPTRLN